MNTENPVTAERDISQDSVAAILTFTQDAFPLKTLTRTEHLRNTSYEQGKTIFFVPVHGLIPFEGRSIDGICAVVTVYKAETVSLFECRVAEGVSVAQLRPMTILTGANVVDRTGALVNWYGFLGYVQTRFEQPVRHNVTLAHLKTFTWANMPVLAKSLNKATEGLLHPEWFRVDAVYEVFENQKKIANNTQRGLT